MADDIVVGSVAVDIVPDTRNFRRDMNAKLQGLEADVAVKADTSGVRAELDETTRKRVATIGVTVDGASAKAQLALLQNDLRDKTLALNVSTTDAQAKIAGIQAQIAEIKGNADLDTVEAELRIVELKAEAQEIKSTLDLNTAPARAEIATLRAEIAAKRIAVKVDADVNQSQVAAVGQMGRGLGGISTLAAGLITLGPALIPILAALAGVGIALGAPLAIAGGGATVFGFLAGFAVKDTAKQLKAISDQRKKLGELTKGTKEYADAQDDLRVLTSGLSPAQKKFSDALDHIKGSFATLLTGKVGDQLLSPVTTFLNVTADTLPKLAPVIGAVSGALSTLLGDLGKAVKGPEFQAFITAFSKQVGPDIVSFGRIAGNVFKGVADLAISLGDAFGPGLLNGIENLTSDFADWAGQAKNSQKLQDFVDYFHRVGPQVADTIGAVARGVGHVVTALAPLGPPALKVIEGIANAISGIPIPVLTGMAAAFGAVALASKANSTVGKLGGLLGSGGFGGRGASPARPLWVQSVNGGGIGGKGGSTGGVPIAKIGLLAALVTAGDIGNEVPDISGRGLTLGPKDFLKSARAGKITRSQLDDPALAQLFGLTQGQARKLFDGLHLKSTTDQVDNLKASLDKASQTIDQVGPKADRSFGQASKDVRDFSARLDAIHDKKVKVLLDDLEAVQKLRALQALRLKDKTLTIKVEQELDRVVGPGGGIGHPLGGGSSGGAGGDLQAAPRSSRTSGRDAPLVNVENMQAHDYNDFLRQSQNRVISRGGGGVLLQGAV